MIKSRRFRACRSERPVIFILSTIAALVLWAPAARAIPDPPQIINVGNYTFEISQILAWDSKDEQDRPVEGLRIYLTVKRGESELLFRQEGNFYGYGDPSDPKNSSLTDGTDLNGDGEPDLIVAEKIYDPEINWKYWIFSAGKNFKLLGKITGAQNAPAFRDKDGKPKFPEHLEEI